MNTLTPPVTVVPIAPVVQDVPIVITPATAILAGTELRRIVGAEPAAPFARASRRFGDLVVELVRSHSTWRLFLADMVPIRHTTRDLWATAASAPSVEWSQTPDGCTAWCEWLEPMKGRG